MSESIRKVSTIFTLDDSEHNRKLKDINSQYKLTQSEIKLAGERLNAFGKDTDNLKHKQEALNKQTETLKDKINLYRDSIEKSSARAEENNKKLQALKDTKQSLQKEYQDAIKLYGEESTQAQKLKEELDKVNSEYVEQKAVVDKNISSVNNHKVKLNETEAQLARVQGELKKTSDELDKQNNKWIQAGETLQAAGKKISSFGDGMIKTGKTLTATVTLPLAALGTASVKSAIDFESAYAGVIKTVDGTAEQMKALEQGIRDMSKELPSSAVEIAAVAESAGQLGIQTDNILGFTRTIIDLGNATNLVGEEGASQLAKFANITQMSQNNFDRLGSTIVALGNNMATTEADIVSMAMRLAGAGKQVGMSESAIVSFAAALSSVGIEAEAGGSAFSKVMLEIQAAIQTGSEGVEDFAKVAGMSTKEFSQAFEKDATGALITFIEGLGKLDNKAVVLEKLGLSEIRVRDALLRASSASDLFRDSINLGSQAWEENTALTKEAEQRYGTTASQMAMLKNEVVDIAIDLGRDLLPLVKDGLIVAKDVVKALKDMNPETREMLLKFAGIAMIAGPVISGIGGIAKGIGGIVSLAGTASTLLGGTATATAAVGTASATAAGTAGVAGLTSSLGGVIAVAAPYALAAAVVAGAGYLVYKGLTQEVIPAVDLFADKIEYTTESMNAAAMGSSDAMEATITTISEGTQKAIEAYLEMDESTSASLLNMFYTSERITNENSAMLIEQFDTMGNTIKESLQADFDETMTTMQEFFADSSALTSENEAEILANTSQYYQNKQNVVDDYEQRIKNIIQLANEENRALTQAEAEEILRIQGYMREEAVKTLSQNEVESNLILERMKEYSTRISAEQASEYIKNLNKSKDNAIKAAEEEYDKKVETYIRMRDETGLITKEQADKLIAEAQRQRDGVVKAAEETRDKAVDKIFGMNKELQDNVDASSGKIIGWWQKMFGEWDRWKPAKKTFSYTVTSIMKGNGLEHSSNALGTSYFKGGLTTVNERGYELIDLPRGTKIKNHESSEQMVQSIAEKTVREVLKGINLGGESKIIIPINFDGREIAEIEAPHVNNIQGNQVRMAGRGVGIK